MRKTALDGLKVLDLGRGVSAPFCARVLADFGADVLKVEPSGEGDASRRSGPFPGDLPDIEKSALYLCLNAGKRGITLNPETKSGQDLLTRLVKDSDVVVENFAPAYLPGLGMSLEALSKLNPSLVLASISWFGQTGPYRDYQGSDIVAQALGGLMELTGLPDREPLKLAGPQAEYLAGLNAAGATLAALHWRDQTGEGQHVDISVMECVASVLEGAVLGYEYSGVLRQRAGSRHPLLYPSGIMPARDGYLYVDGGGDLDSLSRFLDVPQLLDPRFKDDPRSHADEIDSLIGPKLQERLREDLFDAAQLWRLPFGLALNIPELLEDPQCLARASFASIEHPEAGPATCPGAPFRMSGTPWQTARPAPRLGEHNEAVYCGRLGLDKTLLSRLRGEGAI